MSKKKLFIITFGCQMNEYDSQRMIQILHDQYMPVNDPSEADLVIINTCSIREKAEHKLYSLAGRYKPLKKKKPSMIIGIAGCVAQQEGEKLLKRMEYIDLVFGPQGLYRLPEMIALYEKEGRRSVYTGLEPDFEIPLIDAPLPERPVRSYVTIMQGCNNFCSYCIVPFVRGRETSRPAEDIIREVEMVTGQDAKDITLLGQNVNSYGGGSDDFPSFPELLEQVDRIDGLKRLRFTTSHPKDLSDDLISAFGQLETLCEHLHLPVQAGSTTVLRRMNRRYTREEYLEKVEKLRRKCPGITLTTDIIVGFPGETEQDFEQTLSLLEMVKYDQIFAFKYSERPDTAALKLDGKVPEEVKSRRLEQVLQLQNRIGLEQYRKMEGRTVEVLVEAAIEKREGELQLRGRTRGNHVVNFSGDASLAGQFVNVFIERACNHSLSAILA